MTSLTKICLHWTAGSNKPCDTDLKAYHFLIDSNIDANIELNNYGYHIDECQFNVRTPATLMNYKDNNNVTRALTGSVSLVLQLERSF